MQVPNLQEIDSRLTTSAKALANYVAEFMRKHALFCRQTAYVCVSGGMDSMALLYVLTHLRQRGELSKLHVLHVNHANRPGQEEDERLVRQVCQVWRLPLTVKRQTVVLGSNFEQRARHLRCAFFESQIASLEDAIYTAHHIDDSFEWNLMQQWRSSCLKTSMGIPLKRGVYRRPFNCLTRAQLTNFVKQLRLPFRSDPSNQEISYERNYIRQQIVPLIRARYPKYLKHYVHRANQWAKNLKSEPHRLLCRSGHLGSSYLLGSSFEQARGLIRELIHKHSDCKRGQLSTQIERLIAAQRVGKRGPLSFSGGVEVFCDSSGLAFFSRENFKRQQRLDRDLARSCSRWLERKLKAEKASRSSFDQLFPFFEVASQTSELETLIPSEKRPHPLWPYTTESFLKANLWFQTRARLSRVRAKELNQVTFFVTPVEHVLVNEVH